MKNITTLAALLLILLTGCTNNKEKATALLNRAKQSFQAGQYNLAKLQIDSIRTLYPKEAVVRVMAVKVMQEVEYAEQTRVMKLLDEEYAQRKAELDSVHTNFTLEKDTNYQEMGHYLFPSQVVERNMGRSYLRVRAAEDGRLLLTSVYCAGGKLHHQRIRVAIGDTFAETPASTDTYEMNIGGRVIELADYAYPKDGGVITLIRNASVTDKIKLEFLGEHTYSSWMTADDVKAVKAVAKLSELLTEITRISKEQREATLKIRFLEQRMKELVVK